MQNVQRRRDFLHSIEIDSNKRIVAGRNVSRSEGNRYTMPVSRKYPATGRLNFCTESMTSYNELKFRVRSCVIAISIASV